MPYKRYIGLLCYKYCALSGQEPTKIIGLPPRALPNHHVYPKASNEMLYIPPIVIGVSEPQEAKYKEI